MGNLKRSPNVQSFVYYFGEERVEGDPKRKDLLGGKGAGLAEMIKIGIPVPPGFTISTEICSYYLSHSYHYPESLKDEVSHALKEIEKSIGATFGDSKNPLLVSVRSGAAVSMPGMMDTILNLGLNDETLLGLIHQTQKESFAYDSYRRFLQMYGNVVLGIESHEFERLLDEKKKNCGGTDVGADHDPTGRDADLSISDLKDLVNRCKGLVKEKTGTEFPQDPHDQLWGAIGAVFRSWNSQRARTYRKINRISSDIGTAVNVQAMVFGNLGNDCATGVAFTRHPSIGEKEIFGEYLINAQGEDVVSGIRTPAPISGGYAHSLQKVMPKAFGELKGICDRLESYYADMQDIEFTIQKGKVWFLQTRRGKRSAAAAIRIAVDMVDEKIIDKAQAILRIDPKQTDQLLHPMIDPEVKKEPLAKGLPASPGAATGVVVFSPDRAEELAGQGSQVILVRMETSPEDIHGMHVASGILTARGGMTCISGETRVLTDRGLLRADELFCRLAQDQIFRILSIDSRTMKSVWREIIAAGTRSAEVLSVSVSQTGHSDENLLRLTANHKMYTFQKRQSVKKTLEQVLADEDFIHVVGEVPALGETFVSPALAYVTGAILADGYIRLLPTKGSVTFTQKESTEKAEFIAAVERAFHEAFGVSFSYIRERTSEGVLRGRRISGTASDRICFRREPAERLTAIQNNLVEWVLTLDRVALLNFLAGYVDGDGTYTEESSAVRLQIYVSGNDQARVDALVLSCLRLGIVPRVVPNREHVAIQISEKMESILGFTHRVHAEPPPRLYESRLFALKGLFEDIIDDVNFMGRIREGLKRNLMFGAEKIRRDILPLCPGQSHQELFSILNSSLRSYRVKKVRGPELAQVYNFEVDAATELDKNFIVFSQRLTPVLVSNSHAAVVARGMGKCCVVGCHELHINYKQAEMTICGKTIKEGDTITLDGTSGNIYEGEIQTVRSKLDKYYDRLMSWVDEVRTLRVRTNADTPHDTQVAREFGAEGIGLCRTEHMFFDLTRIDAMREMILADTGTARRKALSKIMPMQKQDFKEIFRQMQGYPVTIRLLDPPLHEFLPHNNKDLEELSKKIDVPFDRLKRKAKSLDEFNPMLGFRGCRLGIAYPEIYEMQVRAIMEAACELVRDEQLDLHPEIMVPIVGDVKEFRLIKDDIVRVCEEVQQHFQMRIKYEVGTMIELPRAALVADRIAAFADFFSFGTNDLTQTTFGISRDDSQFFLPQYVEKGIYEGDPFVSLDQEGVGRLIEMASHLAKKTKPAIPLGICGEHGGDSASIEFCHKIGLNYVSCSPYRVPQARLSAAQAALKNDLSK